MEKYDPKFAMRLARVPTAMSIASLITAAVAIGFACFDPEAQNRTVQIPLPPSRPLPLFQVVIATSLVLAFVFALASIIIHNSRARRLLLLTSLIGAVGFRLWAQFVRGRL